MPEVTIPKEFARKKKLIAVPVTEYRRLIRLARIRDEELAEVLASEEEYRQGRYVTAPNVRAALKEARARGWFD
ncbi:hypothetical protein HY523_00260 [Candidatus Berkelbacteria bacterium]|nr:hypothetical protein [Candidatus Berkelbacteria bacterium]